MQPLGSTKAGYRATTLKPLAVRGDDRAVDRLAAVLPLGRDRVVPLLHAPVVQASTILRVAVLRRDRVIRHSAMAQAAPITQLHRGQASTTRDFYAS